MNHINKFGQVLGNPVDNWTPRERPLQARLSGRYCYLEPVDINKHANALFDALLHDNPGESWTYLPYGPFAHVEEFKVWLKTAMADSGTQLYTIFDAKTDLPVGIAGYLRINHEQGVIEIGHVHFSKLLKQTPAATESIFIMLQHAFDDLGYRRCEWKCNSLNEASRKAAFRFGFQFEGTFRQYAVFKGRNRDTDWFAMLDHEWPDIKIKFQKWLQPHNYDHAGRQILKLTEC